MFSREIKSGSNTNHNGLSTSPKNDATEMATSLGNISKRVEPNLVLFKICAINLLKFFF
jgi:hypothetical protein